MLRIDRQSLSSVSRSFGIRLVVLFGSRAKGRPEPRPESDVDIAIHGCPRERYWDCYKAINEAISVAELDLVRLEEADPLFRDEIMQSGVLLDGDPDFFFEFRAYAYKDFVDSADLFTLEETLFRKKMQRLGELFNDSSRIRSA